MKKRENKIETSIILNGKTEEAFNFYRSIFGGEFTMFKRFKDAPSGEKFPKAQHEKVMYVCLPIGSGTTLMGWDHLPSQGKHLAGNNFRLSLSPSSREETDRIFAALAEGGKIESPLEDTFWDSYFGMLTDKFGIQWMLNYEKE